MERSCPGLIAVSFGRIRHEQKSEASDRPLNEGNISNGSIMSTDSVVRFTNIYIVFQRFYGFLF